MCGFFSESRGLLLRLGRLKQANLMWNSSCRSWPYLFEFAISTVTPLDGSSDSHVFLKDAANFELRAKVCLQLEPHLSAVIFTPGTYGSSDCFESPVGFGVVLLRKWAYIYAAVSRPVKSDKPGRSLEKEKVGGDDPLPSRCCPPLQPFKR